ncbi:MAG: hypothetical protein ABWX70_00295, partial [Hyphomicrobium sp.]
MGAFLGSPDALSPLVAGPPLVRPVGSGVPAKRARLAAIEGGSVEKSGCVDGWDGKPLPLVPRGDGAADGTPVCGVRVGVSLRREAGMGEPAAEDAGGPGGDAVEGGMGGGGVVLARAKASTNGETMFGGLSGPRSGAGLAGGGMAGGVPFVSGGGDDDTGGGLDRPGGASGILWTGGRDWGGGDCSGVVASEIGAPGGAFAGPGPRKGLSAGGLATPFGPPLTAPFGAPFSATAGDAAPFNCGLPA